MERIIAGRFPSTDEANDAAALLAQYVERTDICTFYFSQPGHPAGNAGVIETHDNPDAENPGKSSAATAVAAGIAAGVVGAAGGPFVAVAAAGVGAYGGSLVGALGGLGSQDDKPHSPVYRHAGMMLAVHIANPMNEQRIIDTLRAEGAADIELARGEWSNGDWTDFDPDTAPQLVN